MESILNIAMIKAVKRRPELYNRTAVNYSNRDFISSTWREVAQQVGLDNGVEARKKWTKLRDYFRRNHRQISMCKTGLPPELQKKKWYLYDRLSFLLPYLSDKNGLFDFSEEPDGVQDMEDDNRSLGSPSVASMASTSTTDTEDRPTHRHQAEQRQEPQRKRSRHNQHFQEPVGSSSASFDHQMSKTIRNGTESREEDEDEQYFKSLLPKMRLLDPITKMECQMEIHSVVLRFLKQTQRLPNHTQIPPPVTPNQEYSFDCSSGQYDTSNTNSSHNTDYPVYNIPQKTELI